MRADQLAKLVDGLIDYATIRAAPMSISLEPLSLATLARTSVEGIGPMLSEHPLVVEDSTLISWADRAAMSRILDNLLSNATKYSPAGSPVTVAFAASDDLVRVSITDQGRGIAPEDLDTIFVEFNRGRLAENDGGTGLGLASVQRLTSLQGGRTWVESRLGHGTTVTVELARAPDAAQVLELLADYPNTSWLAAKSLTQALHGRTCADRFGNFGDGVDGIQEGVDVRR